MIWSITVLPFFVALALAISRLVGRPQGPLEWGTTFALLTSIALLPLLRRGLPVSTTAYAFVVLLTGACLVPVYFSGGRSLPPLMMLTIFPAIAMVTLGLRGAVFVCGLVISGLLGILAAQEAGIHLTTSEIPEAVFARWLISVPVLVTLASTTLVALLELSRRSAVRELQRYRDEFEESEARLSAAFDAAPVGMGFFRADGSTLAANRVGRDMLGIAPGTPVHESALLSCIHPEDKARAYDFFGRALNGENVGSIEYRWVPPDGRVEWTKAAASVVRRIDGSVRFVVGTAEFITQSKEAEERIRQLAFYDEITGLGNRSFMVERMETAVERARESHRPVAVLFLDLDGFKAVNDSLGHAAGDKVLAEVAHRFASCVRLSDQMSRLPDELHLSRFGGDEFVLLLSQVDGQQGCEVVAKRVMASLELPIVVDDEQIDLGVSIGIAVYPDHGESVSSLLRGADEAMYRAKRVSGSAYCFHEPSVPGSTPA